MTYLSQLPLSSKALHRRRMLSAGRVGLAMVSVSLAVGIGGYMGFEHLDFIDAFLNASMILSGMGPLHVPTSTGGKVFAGIYAIYSGFAVLGIAAVVFAPIVHRIFHRMHIGDAAGEKDTQRSSTQESPAASRRTTTRQGK
ncbi:MAG: hypothetical protein ABIQ72_16990 [Usitatibacter sp.]